MRVVHTEAVLLEGGYVTNSSLFTLPFELWLEYGGCEIVSAWLHAGHWSNFEAYFTF